MLDIDLILNRVSERRNELGWTQRELAERAEVSFEYVNKIESRHQFPSFPMLERLAEVLDMTEEDLFFGADMDGAMYMIPDVQRHFEKWTPATRDVFLKLAGNIDEMDKALKKTRLKYVREKW